MNSLPWLFTLLCALVAILSIWRWRHWKRRALRAQPDLKATKNALHAFGFEVANATNAARAHLIDFRNANPAADMPEHLDQIESVLDRLSAALEKAGQQRGADSQSAPGS